MGCYSHAYHLHPKMLNYLIIPRCNTQLLQSPIRFQPLCRMYTWVSCERVLELVYKCGNTSYVPLVFFFVVLS